MKGVILPDQHHPWMNERHGNKVLDFIDRKNPDLVLQIGDGYDLWSWSRYVRSLNYITPLDELRRGSEDFQTYWAAVRMAAPNAKLVQMMGNHDIRIRKQMMTKFPEAEAVLDHLGLNSLWEADGVETIHDPRAIYRWNGIAFHHGDFIRTTKPGERCKYLLEPVVFGHTHRAWVYWHPHHTNLWEMSVGALAYKDALPLQYSPIRNDATTNGFGYIDDDGPRFIRLED